MRKNAIAIASTSRIHNHYTTCSLPIYWQYVIQQMYTTYSSAESNSLFNQFLMNWKRQKDMSLSLGQQTKTDRCLSRGNVIIATYRSRQAYSSCMENKLLVARHATKGHLDICGQCSSDPHAHQRHQTWELHCLLVGCKGHRLRNSGPWSSKSVLRLCGDWSTTTLSIIVTNDLFCITSHIHD